jgi:hypothetical protein
MYIKHITLTLAVALSTVAFAQSVTNVQTSRSDVFQIDYASNLNVGDSYINFTNSGATTSSSCDSDGTVCLDGPGIGVSQNLCINLYTFDPQEELIACCACSVTPNGLVSLSVVKSLISNPLTPAIPTAVVVKAVASVGTCNAAAVNPANLAHGLLAWGTSLHQNTSTATPTYSVTETPFSQAALSGPELAHITSTCGFIQADGSKFGICGGCPANGLGATSTQ